MSTSRDKSDSKGSRERSGGETGHGQRSRVEIARQIVRETLVAERQALELDPR
jgi:hypothetical protein